MNEPVENMEEKTNYLTDDSDSDLDVICDFQKGKVPPKYKIEQIKENKQAIAELKNQKPNIEEGLDLIPKALKINNSFEKPRKIPLKDETQLLNFIKTKYLIDSENFEIDEPPEPKTNFLTDDSDSDLDVNLDFKKSKLPSKLKPEQLSDPKVLNDQNLKKQLSGLPDEEYIDKIKEALKPNNSANSKKPTPLKDEPNLINYVSD